MLLNELYDLKKPDGSKLITPPKWLLTNTQYMTYMGSIAYGVSTDASDMDIYGVTIPPKEDIFPHLKGEIIGFGRQTKRFNNWQEHHVKHPEKDVEYDFNIDGIVGYFQKCMDCSPNAIDSLFTPDNMVIHITRVGQMIRENRKLFLCKKAWHTFKGYAHSQLHAMSSKSPKAGSKRQKLREQFGFDVKFAYHVYRNLSQVEQILTEGDLDLQEPGRREIMKEIRRGEWNEQQIRNWFSENEKRLEQLYIESKLPHTPREDEIKVLLLQCLEEHYGSLDKVVANQSKFEVAVYGIKELLEKHGIL